MRNPLPKGQADKRKVTQSKNHVSHEIRLYQSFNTDCLSVSEVISGIYWVFLFAYYLINSKTHFFLHNWTFLKLDAFYN